MSGTGYDAVGHLLKLPGVRDHKASLHTLVSAFEENDNDIIQPRGILLFYKFCEDAIVSFESSTEFLRDVLKRHEAEELPFQLKVEKTVWSVIRDHYASHETHQEFCNNDEIEEDTCFLLFCVFNRFCDTNNLEMYINSTAQTFLLKKFGFPQEFDSERSKMPFDHFYEDICKCL